MRIECSCGRLNRVFFVFYFYMFFIIRLYVYDLILFFSKLRLCLNIIHITIDILIKYTYLFFGKNHYQNSLSLLKTEYNIWDWKIIWVLFVIAH